jgi:hypothetical protein
MNTITTRAIVGAVVAMSLMANAVMAQQAGAGKPQGKFKGPTKVFILADQSNMEGLSRLDLADLSYTIVTQQDYAGWNTLITDGVMKETWRGGMAQMPSLGGSIGQWYDKVAAGIRPDPVAPAFKHIIIKPSIMGSGIRNLSFSVHPPRNH